jgi:hypothetical protein
MLKEVVVAYFAILSGHGGTNENDEKYQNSSSPNRNLKNGNCLI